MAGAILVAKNMQGKKKVLDKHRRLPIFEGRNEGAQISRALERMFRDSKDLQIGAQKE